MAEYTQEAYQQRIAELEATEMKQGLRIVKLEHALRGVAELVQDCCRHPSVPVSVAGSLRDSWHTMQAVLGDRVGEESP